QNRERRGLMADSFSSPVYSGTRWSQLSAWEIKNRSAFQSAKRFRSTRDKSRLICRPKLIAGIPVPMHGVIGIALLFSPPEANPPGAENPDKSVN
ncbi:MAG: hypothetical protein L6455_05050, partial [Kiritimatiellae bacterium]|nr:hypothetical protein [Verrucomicrobiota bacterium]MBU4291734.1 hypothetical protein [Verrucomicrobiota bacterium]MCG2679324.1 hypothetical protein [Kiritimatiellia bacterium]